MYGRAAIIPHAGKQFAGDARKTIFNILKQNSVKYIIYISASHSIKGLQPNTLYRHNPTETYDGGDAFLNNINDKYFINTINKLQPLPPNKEHSFEWVENELKREFEDAHLLVLTPYGDISESIKSFVNIIKNNENMILLATTDLTHYGDDFGNRHTIQHPPRLSARILEEKLLHALTNPSDNIKTIQEETSKEDLLCGPYSILFFSNIIKKLEWKGKIVDYYDSSTSQKNPLSQHVIDDEDTRSFVSYVSIIYGKNIHQDILTQLDIHMGIGIVKTVIVHNMGDYEPPHIRFPKWHPFRRTTTGVFVGSRFGKHISCSYGRYESEHDDVSTAEKIVAAAKDCIKDASNRWGRPYTQQNIHQKTFKIELLQERKYWLQVTPDEDKLGEYLSIGKKDNKYGVYLTLKNGSSATYLPSVAEQFTTIGDYMNQLAKKAGGGDWIHGTILLYTTNVYEAK